MEAILTRRIKKPSPEELEAQADAILRKDQADSIAAILDHVQTIAAGMETLRLPSNDPHYLSKLQAAETARANIAKKLTQIELVPSTAGNGQYIGLGWFPNHEARELAQKLAQHFEVTNIRQHE